MITQNDQKEKVPGIFTPQVAVLWLVGLCLNAFFAQLVLFFKLPLFLDNIGSVLVAALAGPLPGMTVGFVSNLINSIADPITLYYGILTVFIALVADVFSKMGWLKKLWGCLLAALLFVLIGGAVGSCMTWMLYGGGIGEGISAPCAQLLFDWGLPAFWAQLAADILIDIPDKLLTILPVGLFLNFYPKKLYNLFPYSYIYDRSEAEGRKALRQTRAHYRKISIRTRILSTIAISVIAISASSTAIGVVLNRQDVLQSNTNMVESTAQIAATVIDGDRVEEFLQGDAQAPAYQRTRKALENIKANTHGLKYLYVYQVQADGCHIVFDFDIEGDPAWALGTVVPFEEEFEGEYAPYLELALQGVDLPAVSSNGHYGSLVTAYAPVRDSAGNTVAYACADVSTNNLKSATLSYIIKMIAIQFAISVLILAFALWYAQERLVSQVDAVVELNEQFRKTDPEIWLESDAWQKRTPVRSGDEIEELYKSVCSAEEEVANNVKKLKHSKALEQKNQELAEAIRRAREASAAKSDFLSRMSHDIRTPLNGIIGMTEIAMQDNTDPEVQKSLELIASSSHFLLSLINDILDISKIESGSMTLHEQPVALSEFDNVINSVVRPLMQSKNIEFIYEMGCGMQVACIDPVRFNQVFFNLLSNASKFTPEGGRVEFLAERMSADDAIEWVRFIVRDNGIGMKQEFIAHAFLPFEQDEEHTGRLQNQGTGLGLAITKELVELMGGRILVKSELGVGSEFIVELPLKRTTLPDAAQGEQKKRKTDEILQGKRVLLAEDNNINATVAMRLLQAKGMLVDHVENGALAVEAIRGAAPGQYAAVLMDIRMPVMDGLEATRQIRALDSPVAKTIPIIAMTANAYEEDVRRTKEAGMNAHLSKPIMPELLYSTLTEQIG